MRLRLSLILAALSVGAIPGRGQGPDQRKPDSRPLLRASARVELLTPTRPIDFTAYMTSVTVAIRKTWQVFVPRVASEGEQGIVVVRFHVLRDGKIFKKKVLSHSGGKSLLDAAQEAIRLATPFGPFPSGFQGRDVELRVTFVYNLPATTTPPPK